MKLHPDILQHITVPTGDICVVRGEIGVLEMLSIGDYGKDVNLKADFMGLTRPPSPVRHTAILPLEEKWVITISTQYGCRERCRFCDVPKVGRGTNATFSDLVNQVAIAMSLHPEIKRGRINLHYARMGEPTYNDAVITSAFYLVGKLNGMGFDFHPVVSTMMPLQNEYLTPFLRNWVDFKNNVMDGNAGLQLSINSTSEDSRINMFNGRARSLVGAASAMRGLVPKGRKFTLNFALGDWEIDPKVLLPLFDPAHYICKLTPLHRTSAVNSKRMMPEGDWTEYTPYKETEEALKASGYDVIVFIASKEEDESRITCGNAILSNQKENQ